MALRLHPIDNTQWAFASLKKAPGITLRDYAPIFGVFPPWDTGDCAEVIFLDDKDQPRTALLEGDGSVKKTRAGW